MNCLAKNSKGMWDEVSFQKAAGKTTAEPTKKSETVAVDGVLVPDSAVEVPLNPIYLTAASTTNGSISLDWQSAGENTESYLVAHTVGSIPPADCDVSHAANDSFFTFSTLSTASSHSFRICTVLAGETNLVSAGTKGTWTLETDQWPVVSVVSYFDRDADFNPEVKVNSLAGSTLYIYEDSECKSKVGEYTAQNSYGGASPQNALSAGSHTFYI